MANRHVVSSAFSTIFQQHIRVAALLDTSLPKINDNFMKGPQTCGAQGPQRLDSSSVANTKKLAMIWSWTIITRMWVNAQHDGRIAEYMWRLCESSVIPFLASRCKVWLTSLLERRSITLSIQEYGSMVDIQSTTAEIRRGKKRRTKKEEQTTGWKYNGLPYSIGRP